MTFDAVVLGAGIVGVSSALHLQLRGWEVLLVDKSLPGEGASHGNAGIIERSGVIPYAFPRSLVTLAQYALNQSSAVRYDPMYIPKAAPFLYEYWKNSSKRKLAVATAAMLPLIEVSLDEHNFLIVSADAEPLIRRDGWLSLWRSERSLALAVREAQALSRFKLRYSVLDRQQLSKIEPAVQIGSNGAVGAIHWHDPYTVSDPGGLVKKYFSLFERRGGRFVIGNADGLRSDQGNWIVTAGGEEFKSKRAVIALGAQSGKLTSRFGYLPPLGIKRGYHRHYAVETEMPKHTVVDEEAGYVLSPMTRGLRMTTGIEMADPRAPANLIQITRSERVARTLIQLGKPLEVFPWLGLRPCLPDMCPIIGRLPGNQGLWVNFGHAHHGLTIGPASGRLLAELMSGQDTFANPYYFRPERFS